MAVVPLGNVVLWLGDQAEALGVEVFPGFAVAEVLSTDNGAAEGVATGEMGVDRQGVPTDAFQRGMELHAKYTLFAEGSRGHLGKQLMEKYDLNTGKDPQSYSLGIKELWEIHPLKHQPGLVIHTTGWPLKSDTYGGSFLYHLENNQVVVDYVIGLSYENPYLSPYEEFQRYKTHPAIRTFFEGGKRISYGDRAITAGGLQSLPKPYPMAFEKSWLYDELHVARNGKPELSKGLYVGSVMAGIDQMIFRGRAFWTLHRDYADHECLKPAANYAPIADPKPDGTLTFDRLSSVFISNTNRAEDQPVHLTLKIYSVPVSATLHAMPGQKRVTVRPVSMDS